MLPVSPQELRERGIDRPDVILVSGDALIDSPYCGIAVIGRVLEDAGYTVAVIPQPDTDSDRDIAALGEPRLFWGVSSGCVDSEVANYTALGKPRRQCDFTPGGKNDRRPDRACIVYCNLIRRYFKNTVPLVLGGIEASLRRVAHYDFRSGKVRRSLLFDSKADILVYGMGERAVLDIARRLERGGDPDEVPGTCVVARTPPPGYQMLPSFEAVRDDPEAFASMFRQFDLHGRPESDTGLAQPHGDRYLVHHPSGQPLSQQELDRIHELPFTHQAHPECGARGEVRALETIRDSLVTHRGCFGECSFCAIALHQGRRVVSRSMDSIVREAERLAESPRFSGIIKDAGGPTANMYGSGCKRLDRGSPCRDRHCIGYHGVCPGLRIPHKLQMCLLRRLEGIPGVRKVFVSSGVRHDLILADKQEGRAYLEQLISRHVSGRLKIAPEHCSDRVLRLMNKPPSSDTSGFAELYRDAARRKGENTQLSCYAIAAHPGSTLEDMRGFLRFARSNLKFVPKQVQIFTPLPSTRSTAMYYCGKDPHTGERVHSEKRIKGKESQKKVLTARGKPPSSGRKPG